MVKTLSKKKGSSWKFKSFEDVIQFAVKREEEAARTYGRLLKRAQDPSARRLLEDLRQDEREHKKVLLGITKIKVAAGADREIRDLKISDYLVSEPLTPEMSFQDLLIFAAQKEKKAVNLYSDLAKKAKTGGLKKVFDFLVKQEKSHKLRLEIEYDKYVLWED